MASEEPLFEPGLKKKSKKKFTDFDLDDGSEAVASNATPEAAQTNGASDAPPAAAATEEENLDDMFGGLKKKSKKKKAIPMDLEESAPESSTTTDAAADEGDAAATAETTAAAADDDVDLDFGELKKKKKKSKKGGFDLEAFEKELGGDAVEANEAATAEAEELGDDPFAQDGQEGEKKYVESWHGTDRDYTYQELMRRLYETLDRENPQLASNRSKLVIPPPVVQREGSKKTSFSNFTDICKRLHRQPDHLKEYICAEYSVTANVDGSQHLIIRGRFQQAQIESVLRKYIKQYVTCGSCGSPNTSLYRDRNRVSHLQCGVCQSTRSVTNISTGFQAQIGRRLRA